MSPEDVEAVAVAVAEHLAKTLAPRLTYTVGEACAVLGVSWDFWAEHVAPSVRIVRAGRRKLVPHSELERWVAERAELPLSARPSDLGDLGHLKNVGPVGDLKPSRQPRASGRTAA